MELSTQATCRRCGGLSEVATFRFWCVKTVPANGMAHQSVPVQSFEAKLCSSCLAAARRRASWTCTAIGASSVLIAIAAFFTLWILSAKPNGDHSEALLVGLFICGLALLVIVPFGLFTWIAVC